MLNGAPGGSDYYQFEDINLAIIALLKQASAPMSPACILDLGCGRARLGGEIEKLGYRVTGIDHSPTACDAARTRISEVIELDLLDRERITAALGERRFDWLLGADILEHFPDPAELLRFYRRFVRPAGHLIVSLPNVAVWDNRLRVLFGRFNYRETGVMDRSHLRFFTFRTAKELVAETGFTLMRTTFEPGIARAFAPMLVRYVGDREDPGAILESPVYHRYARYVLPVERMICALRPSLLAIRVVLLARLNDFATAPPIHQSQS